MAILPNKMNEDLQKRIDDLEQRLQNQEMQMREHYHSGHQDQRVNLLDIFGKLEVVSVAPVGTPANISGQIKIFTNGTTYRLYWYDTTAGAWHYIPAFGASGTFYVALSSGGAVTHPIVFTDGILTTA